MYVRAFAETPAFPLRRAETTNRLARSNTYESQKRSSSWCGNSSKTNRLAAIAVATAIGATEESGVVVVVAVVDVAGVGVVTRAGRTQ